MNQFPVLVSFAVFAELLAVFEMPYLLESWELDCTNHPDCSARIVDHSGAILVQV
jgi:hypothetical protein